MSAVQHVQRRCLRMEQRLLRRCWRNYWCLGIIVAVVLSVHSLAQASEVEQGNGGVYQLPELVVRAWHFEKSLTEVPADVTRIERAAIDRSPAASLPELLATEGQLFFSNVAGLESLSMRGFGEGSGLRSLILVDGLPLNPADAGRINWEQVPLDSIESIEILRGGHNVLYGDRALSGVIKIETRRSGENRFNLAGRVGSFGRSQASLSAGLGSSAWSLQGGLFREDSEGYRENSQKESRHLYLKSGFTFDNGDDLDLGFSMGETDVVFPGGLSLAEYRAHPRASGNSGDEGSRNRYLTATGRLTGERSWGELELLAGYDQGTSDFSFDTGDYGENAQAGYSFKPRLRIGEAPLVLIVGVDLLYDTLDFTQYLDPARTLVPSDSELSESRGSPYFLLETTLLERLTLSGGVRHEWVRYQVDSVAYDRSQLSPVIKTNRGDLPNPNFKNPPDVLADQSFTQVIHEDGSAAELSLNYLLSTDWSVWAGYDRVYRYPVFDERAAYQGFPLAQNVNQDLEAETGDNFELGLKYLRNKHELYLTAFLLQMENEIIFDPDVTAPGSIGRGLNVNLGPVRRAGLDLAYAYRGGKWGASTRLGWLRTEMRSGPGRGQDVPLVPDFRANNQIWWEPVRALRLRGVHRYVGERYQGGDFANVRPRVEAYHLFDGHVEWRLNPHCRVFASVENILDQRYAESVFFGSYYPGTGRSFSGGVKFNF